MCFRLLNIYCISYIYLNVLSTSIIIAKLYDLPLGISKFEISILIFLLEELNSEQSVENEPKLAGPGEGSQIMSEYSDMAGGKRRTGANVHNMDNNHPISFPQLNN